MAIKTYTEQLESVQAAIAVIEAGGGQSYRIDGREMTRADLATLYAREEYLRKKVTLESNRPSGGIRVRYAEP